MEWCVNDSERQCLKTFSYQLYSPNCGLSDLPHLKVFLVGHKLKHDDDDAKKSLLIWGIQITVYRYGDLRKMHPKIIVKKRPTCTSTKIKILLYFCCFVSQQNLLLDAPHIFTHTHAHNKINKWNSMQWVFYNLILLLPSYIVFCLSKSLFIYYVMKYMKSDTLKKTCNIYDSCFYLWYPASLILLKMTSRFIKISFYRLVLSLYSFMEFSNISMPYFFS